MNGARTTLEVRLVHCIGAVLDLEAVYTLMRSTGLILVVDSLSRYRIKCSLKEPSGLFHQMPEKKFADVSLNEKT